MTGRSSTDDQRTPGVPTTPSRSGGENTADPADTGPEDGHLSSSDGDVYQLTHDTLAYGVDITQSWGVDCPGCDTVVQFLDLVGGHDCDCGARLAMYVAQHPPQAGADDADDD